MVLANYQTDDWTIIFIHSYWRDNELKYFVFLTTDSNKGTKWKNVERKLVLIYATLLRCLAEEEFHDVHMRGIFISEFVYDKRGFGDWRFYNLNFKRFESQLITHRIGLQSTHMTASDKCMDLTIEITILDSWQTMAMSRIGCIIRVKWTPNPFAYGKWHMGEFLPVVDICSVVWMRYRA